MSREGAAAKVLRYIEKPFCEGAVSQMRRDKDGPWVRYEDYCLALDAAYAAGLREGLKDALEIVQEEAEGDIDLADFLIAKRLAHQCSNPQHWDEPHPCKLCAGERREAGRGRDG